MSKETDQNAIATYLLALAVIEQTGKTFVAYEIRRTIKEAEKSLGLQE